MSLRIEIANERIVLKTPTIFTILKTVLRFFLTVVTSSNREPERLDNITTATTTTTTKGKTEITKWYASRQAMILADATGC